jgi:hypothetical protein
MKKTILIVVMIAISFGMNAQNPPSYTAKKAGNLSASFNLKNDIGSWHLSGPRSYEDNNPFSIFWYNGSFHRYFSILDNGNIGIGTKNPGLWKLAVNGNIRAKEIKVETTGWSDFVFYDNYKLPTLKEVENYIKEEGHLKDIPSAREVEKNGIFLGEMDSKLLQKIEELTLYTIEQEKRLNNIDLKNEKLEKENKILKALTTKFLELQKRLEKLEKE